MYLRTAILCLMVVLATVVPAPQHAQAQGPGQPEFPTVPETPGEQGANLPPSDGLQFFGKVTIDGESEDMTVNIRDVADNDLYSVTLKPERA